MLKVLRKKGVAKKVLWFVAIVIIISFGFFGTAYLLTGRNQNSYAGKIFGKNISYSEFEKIYQQVHIQALMHYGEKFSEIKPYLNLEAQTWDRLILLKEAKRRRIKISDEEVIKAIENYPFFQREGHFDTLLYNDILRYVFRIISREFEEGIRDNLKLTKLFMQITSSVILSDQEILEEFNHQNEKIQVSYVFISPDKFKGQTSLNTQEAEAYYTEHKFDFLVPPSVNVEYMFIPFPQEITAVKEEEMKPEEKNKKASILEAGNTIYQSLLTDPDMQKVAKEHQREVQESGFFTQEKPFLNLGWSYDILNTIFSLAPGSIVEPFTTPQGVYIVKVKQKKDAYTPNYQEVEEKVKETLLLQKAREIARQKAGEYLQAIQAELGKTMVKDFAKAAKALEMEIHQTPVFMRGQYLPKIGISKEFQETAFALTEQKIISDVVEITTGYCILHLDTFVPADQKDFFQHKDTIAESLLNERRNKSFNDFLTQIRQKANLIDNLNRKRL